MAMFIRVDVDPKIVAQKEGLAAKLVEVCPVNIFKLADIKLGATPKAVEVVEDNVDECTLCDLCMQ
ncbi:MAG: hypothetical protein ACREQJ_06095, partial [Candidatus Binatia bacterium]